jgi:hypothetical protein
MNLLPFLKPVLDIVDKITPDKNARAEAKEQMAQAIQTAVDTANIAQIRVNEAEAKSTSWFVAAWRPAVGWVCVLGLAWNFVFRPLLTWVAFLFDFDLTTAPELDISDLMTLLMGMLGMSTLRTYEKLNGVSRNVNPK